MVWPQEQFAGWCRSCARRLKPLDLSEPDCNQAARHGRQSDQRRHFKQSDRPPGDQLKATTLGLYVQDTIDLTPEWKLVGDLRLDRFQGDYDRSGSVAPNNTPLSRSDSLLSKRLGVMYQPSQDVSHYAAYGTSFNTSGDLYQFDPRSANTAPESSRNMEIGAK